jgi:hypothetical protein
MPLLARRAASAANEPRVLANDYVHEVTTRFHPTHQSTADSVGLGGKKPLWCWPRAANISAGPTKRMRSPRVARPDLRHGQHKGMGSLAVSRTP